MEKNDTQKPGRKRSLSKASQKKVKNVSSEENGSNNNRPRRRNNASKQKKRSHDESQSEKRGLRWRTNFHCPTNAAEESLLPLLLKYGEKERGMMKTQPYHRIKAIREKCREMHMTPEQAYSMRRTHMMLNNPNEKFGLLRLGPRGAIRESAEIFEKAVARFLGHENISYISEEEQKDSHTDGPTPPTPDFLLKEPVLLNGDTTIHWIEAKMFYGASNVPQGTPNAVGCVVATVEKYVKHYGKGAIVFSFGCGGDLKTELEEKGAKVLDPSLLDLKQMRDHQKTWCANDKGWILP